MVFKRSAMGVIFFQNEAKIFHRHVFIAINIPCKFGEDIFINEWDIMVYVKMSPTDACTYGRRFIISQPSAIGGR